MSSLNKKIIYFFIFFLSLVASFYFGENSSGGSKHDYIVTKKFFDAFKEDFFVGFYLFINPTGVQLPTFYILIGSLSKIFGDNSVKYLYLVISSLVPLILYNLLKKKFSKANKEYLFLLSLLIFLSPYFRSSAVWLTTDNLALLFFLLSINFFLKLENPNNKFFKNAIICFFFLILASYIRHYYGVFFIFYFIKIQSRARFVDNIYIILFNLFCSIPLIMYVVIISKSPDSSQVFSYVKIDFIFNFLIFTSLFLFYFTPLVFNKYGLENFIKLLNYKKKIIFLLIFLSSIIFLFYEIPVYSHGGGMFYKISNLFNLNLFFFFSLSGLLFLYIFNDNNIGNNLIYLILIIFLPKMIIFQKYYDPLIYILFLTLINSKFINDLIENHKVNLKFIYIYNLIFLVSCNLYYL